MKKLKTYATVAPAFCMDVPTNVVVAFGESKRGKDTSSGGNDGRSDTSSGSKSGNTVNIRYVPLVTNALASSKSDSRNITITHLGILWCWRVCLVALYDSGRYGYGYGYRDDGEGNGGWYKGKQNLSLC